MNTGVMRLFLCASCMTVLLLMGSHPSTRKISLTSWEAAPDPTIQSIEKSPDVLTMGDLELM